MDTWNVEAYLFDVEADTITDRIGLDLPEKYSRNASASQFSMLRTWARSVCPTKEAEERKHMVLHVQHAPTAEELMRQIYRDGNKFRTRDNGELITLEASVKLMKKEITEWLKGTE